jgi:hypothetical protein
MQGIEGGLQALLQVLLLRLSFQSLLIDKLLSLCRISLELGHLVGQAISFRPQQRIFGRKTIHRSLQRGLIGGGLGSNS